MTLYYVATSVPVQLRAVAVEMFGVDPRDTISGGGRTYIFSRLREHTRDWVGLDRHGNALVEYRLFRTLREAREWALFDALLWR
jgi:hypothetical protein